MYEIPVIESYIFTLWRALYMYEVPPSQPLEGDSQFKPPKTKISLLGGSHSLIRVWSTCDLLIWKRANSIEFYYENALSNQ